MPTIIILFCNREFFKLEHYFEHPLKHSSLTSLLMLIHIHRTKRARRRRGKGRTGAGPTGSRGRTESRRGSGTTSARGSPRGRSRSAGRPSTRCRTTRWAARTRAGRSTATLRKSCTWEWWRPTARGGTSGTSSASFWTSSTARSGAHSLVRVQFTFGSLWEFCSLQAGL